MKLVKYIPAFSFFGYFSLDILLGFAQFLTTNTKQILTTPHGLAILPISLSIPQEVAYFNAYNDVNIGSIPSEAWIYGISTHLATIFIYHITALFLYFYAKVTRLEKAFIIFSFSLAFYFLFFLDFISANKYHSCFLYLALGINVPFIYLFRSIFGLGMHWLSLFLLSLSLSLIGFLFFPVDQASETTMIKIIGLTHTGSLLYCLSLYLWQGKQVLQSKQLGRPIIREILALATLVSLVLPSLSFLITPYLQVYLGISKNALFFIPSLLPMVLFILSLKFGLVYFEVPIYSWLIRIIYFIFFSCVYWFSIGTHISQLQYYDLSLIWHLVALVIFLFVIDPLRTIFFIYVNQYLINRRFIYRRYLSQAATTISNPRQILPFIEKFADTAKDGLGVHQVKVIFADSAFKDWRVESKSISFISDKSEIWAPLKSRKSSNPYPVFTQNISGPIKDFLLSTNTFLLIAFQKFNVFIIISDKINREPFFSEDVSYLRSLVSLSEPLLENYRFLIANIHLRKQEKELELASRIQRKIIPTHYKTNGIEFISYFRASQKVTGDYIDFIETGNTKSIFLGDVSGHGLGSAYLMAVLRSMIRGVLSIQNSSLAYTFNLLNDYLSDQYKGSDFMTLFGINLKLNRTRYSKVLIEYINAGQHPALVYLKDSKQLLKLEKSQRVLGVITTNYNIDRFETNESFRLFLYSDGAFEIFDDLGKMLGEQTLHHWIKESIQLAPKEQLEFLKGRIWANIKNKDELDDISLLILDVDV